MSCTCAIFYEIYFVLEEERCEDICRRDNSLRLALS